MNIWILNSASGIKLFYQSYLKMNIDEDLVSGLLSAFNQFTMSEFQGQKIESIEMGGFRWIYLSETKYNLLFVVADTKNESTDILRSKLNIIKEAFVKEHKEDWKKRGNSWDGAINIFLPFKDIIDNFFYDWEEAKIVMSLADLFTIIGVFQQILDFLHKIIDSSIGAKEKEKINRLIKKVFEDFQNQPEIKNDLELRKMTFSKEGGFNIIDVKPANCDPIIVKKNLIKFTIITLDLIKDEIGEDLCLKQFRDGGIYNYIFNNLKILKELNLDIFLLKLFLLI